MVREWLGAMLRGDNPRWVFPGDASNESICDEINREGVVALLHERINAAAGPVDIPAGFREHIAALARKKSQQSLMREAECRRILANLQKAGIKVLLLKGSALAYWLYPSAHLRDCSDIDLLFCSYDETRKAIGLLQSMQYSLRDPAMAGDLTSFEQTCVRDSNAGTGLEIDLHWRLSSSPMFAYQFDFDELDASSMALPRLGPHARGLSPVHAFFNACMHRIQNMSDGTENCLKWLYDLHLLASQFSPAEWQMLVDVSIDRKFAGICLDGLQATKREFGTSIPEDVPAALEKASKKERMQIGKMQGWFYIQRMSFSAFPTLRLRLRWLRQRLIPNGEYLKARYGESNFVRLLFKRIRAGLQRLS